MFTADVPMYMLNTLSLVVGVSNYAYKANQLW